MRSEILKAYVRIRKIDSTIPDDVLDYMKHAALNYATLKAQRDELLEALNLIAEGTHPRADKIAKKAIENCKP